jgi:filamentous hemagglutinin family protein
LPVPKPGGLIYGASIPGVSGSEMTIYQTQPQAIIDWSSFNIGSGASVYFNQQGNTSWAALNRIWDASPSQIFGVLRADGKIYLINQNGILFGPSAQVNVHTLIASSLNLSIDNFLSGTLAFDTSQGTMSKLSASALEGTTIYGNGDPFYDQSDLPGTASNPGVVSNTGTIQTDIGGSVFLIGPQVENSGTIVTPSGQIGLAAGTNLELVTPLASDYPGGDARSAMGIIMNDAPSGSAATNFWSGSLSADTGLVGMYGNIVNQNGLIRSVTAVQQASHVELLASGTINTGIPGTPGYGGQSQSQILLPVDTSSTTIAASSAAQSSVLFSGIDPDDPFSPGVFPNLIVHEGSIVAPGGLVTMNAVKRVYLGSGSLIDVSGLLLQEPASAGLYQVQMNTVNLRDNFSQKGGVLQSATITIDQLSGSSIGDVSGAYATQSLTAQEWHTTGGTVDIMATGSSAKSGDIVEMQGAKINFSGGGIVYGAGAVDTTVLVSGTNLYNIANAPTDILYDMILNTQTFTNSRFGITDTYQGLYYGGAYPAYQYSSPSYTVGANAGTLSLIAPTVVLDGTILGAATNGPQQVLPWWTETSAGPVLGWSPTNSTGNQSQSGYSMALAGTLNIGDAALVTNGVGQSDAVDYVTQAIVVSPQTTPVLPAAFRWTDPLPSSTTVLSAATLTNAGLSSLNLAANTSITIQKDAQITLSPGFNLGNPGFNGASFSFSAVARQIVDEGGVTAPGGTISLSLKANMTSTDRNNPQLNEAIYLGGSSSLDVSGERTDDATGAISEALSATKTKTTNLVVANGGSISVQDQTVTDEGVFVSPGALIDVSGGWLIGPSGNVSGGDAGKVTLQGSSLVVDGTLLGLSLVGNKGGKIAMTAPNITIASSPGVLPAGFTADSITGLTQQGFQQSLGSLYGQLIFGANQLDGSGFTNITLNSIDSIGMQSGALGPSLAKLAVPSARSAAQTSVPGGSAVSGTIVAIQDQVGASAITLNAGASASGMTSLAGNLYGLLRPNGDQRAEIFIGPQAAITASPNASSAINMTANIIDIWGSLSAPAGTIILQTTGNGYVPPKGAQTLPDGSITLESTAALQAEGYNQPAISVGVNASPASPTPLSGGSIALAAAAGLNLSPGSIIDVSAASPVEQTVVGNNGIPSFITNAGAPGSISLSGATIGGLSGSQAATLKGLTSLPGLKGGTLAVTAGGAISLQISDLARIGDEGFDSLSLTSGGDFSIGGSGSVTFGRNLSLTAGRIVGSNSDQLTLEAPWITLTGGGSSSKAPVVSPGQAGINLSGAWIDIAGNVAFSGFSSVSLSAVQDITLSDKLYDQYAGLLSVSGDLTLQAAGIYPTTLSNFAPYVNSSGVKVPGGIQATGKVTILPSGSVPSGPIYSAGGNLAIAAGGAGIDQEGYLAAPLGSISLEATSSGGRVYLGNGSVITTAASSVPVVYGAIQLATDSSTLGDNIWAIPDKANPKASVPYTQVGGAPPKSVNLQAPNGDVIMSDGATVDVSGGGSVFASRFVPSYSGSNNPFTSNNPLGSNTIPASYVVVPDNSVFVPGGERVYLSGGAGLPAGYYALVPTTYVFDANGNAMASYAFTPGAMIVTDLGPAPSANKIAATPDGYPIVTGYSLAMGTALRSSMQLENYEVRPVSVVLSQGDFETQSATAGSAGSITITANTAILNGTIQASALTGYSGGSIAFSGQKVTVESSIVALPTDFGFSTPVPSDLAGTLNVAAPSLSGQGFQTIGLGVSDLTGSSGSIAAVSVELKPDVSLQAENIILGASSTITLDAGAQVLALAPPGDTGAASFISPSGTLNIGANALVRASNSVNLQTQNTVINPTATLKASDSSLNLQGSAITIAPSTSSGPGLFLTTGQWNSLAASFDNITLTSLSDMVFEGSFASGALAAVADTLTIDAGRIMDTVAGSSVFLSAGTIVLQNTRGAPSVPSGATPTSQITMTASQIQVNPANVLFDGFSSITMNGRSNVTFSGAGSLTTGGGNLTVATPRVATSYYGDPASGTYTAADYAINAGTGTVVMEGNGLSSASVGAPGGTLAVSAGEIDVSTIVEVPSGQIELTASGNINLGSGSQLLSRGTAYAPGGVVSLTSTNGGGVALAAGSIIDVSAGTQGDAGSVNIYAPIGGATLNGSILGQASGGKGGSFSLATTSLDTVNGVNEFSALNTMLAAGGLTGALSFETTAGNITIAAADSVRAQSLTISADAGSIVLDGTIDVSQPGRGGTVGLYAGQDLTVDPSGYINAQGTATTANPNAIGGSVALAVVSGRLTFANGTIDVSGAGTGTGGSVLLRDPPPPPSGGGAQTDMSLAGTIEGASSVVAEIDKVYLNQFETPGTTTTVINSSAISQIQSDLATFIAANASLATELPSGLTDGNGNSLTSVFHLQPGVVIEQTGGDITLSANWDLTNWRYGTGNEPGALTLRAAGNLNIDGSITDAPANVTGDYTTLYSSTAQPSWSINLVAGANTASANLMAVKPYNVHGAATGNLSVGAESVVYTEKGAIQFASGGNTILYPSPLNGYMIVGADTSSGMFYSLGSYAGPITGNVDGNLIVYPLSAIQSAVGNINIRVGGYLDLTGGAGAGLNSDFGAVRTTGEYGASAPYGVFSYDAYGNGGSITLNVGGDVIGGLNSKAWLGTDPYDTSLIPYVLSNGTIDWITYNPLTAAYSQSTSTEGNISTEGIAAMGGGSVSVSAGGDVDCQIGTFGQGDLHIYSGGNVTGRFLVEQGTGTISAMGNFGEKSVRGAVQTAPQLVEIGNSQVSISAQGNVEIGEIVNQNLAEPVGQGYWDNGYTQQSSVALAAAMGSVNMYGSLNSSDYGQLLGSQYAGYLPPTVAISAGKDIVISGSYTQLPAQDGNLTMQAGRNIVFDSGGSWLMSDADLSAVYPGHPITPSPSIGEGTDASTPVHTGDSNPVVISAGGDITNMNIVLPKMARITAGGDIAGLNYSGQNIGPTDLTSIVASGDITYAYGLSVGSDSIQVGGPGYVVVQAGGTIDLGYSNGIQAVGNGINRYLSEAGASLIVAAGYTGSLTTQGVSDFFTSLQDNGTDYATLQAEGETAQAQAVIAQTRSSVIVPFLAGANQGEDITMTSSQISTVGGGSLSVIATGTLNVGTATIGSPLSKNTPAKTQTGLLTETGGAINVFTVGDVNVNESRVMTFEGGDVTIWSDRGNINAGKGSRTAISTSKPRWISLGNGVWELLFQPPSVGSGIRALTYAPNAYTQAPPEGIINLFAPQGVIDAGEAGISGSKVVLGAVTVLNAQNISFSAGSVGVPTASQTVSLGALTGVTNLGEKTALSEDTGALASSQGRVAAASASAIEDLVKWVDVKVIGYDLSLGVAGGPDSDSSDDGKDRTDR